MNSLNIDFRGESLRVLSAKDGAMQHVLISKNFLISDPGTAKEQLLAAVKDAGGRRGKVNVILPHSIIKSGIFQVPAMDISDAEKVVRREISKELGTQDFVLGVRRIIRNLQGKQDILAEYALKSDMKGHLSLLKASGLKPSVITTSLEGIVQAFNRISPSTDGNEAVLEIGLSFIEIIVFNDGKLINYKKVQIPAIDDSKLSGKEMDHAQICKIKMYTIVDALYNFIMESGSGRSEEKINRLWISGLGSIEEGTAQCVSEGLGVHSSLLNPFDREVEHASIYAAVAGLSMLSPSDQVVNLLPQEDKDRGRRYIGKSTLIAVLILYGVLIVGGYALLGRTEKELMTVIGKIGAEIKALQKSGTHDKGQQDAMKKVMSSNRLLYPVFRDIANLAPSEISLTRLDIEKTGDKTFLQFSAVLRAGDEGLRNGLISKFLNTLEGTGRLKISAPPEISTASAGGGARKNEFMVKARFEVLQ